MYRLAGYAAPALLSAVARECLSRTAELSGQALANVAWAFATLKLSEPELFAALARETHHRIRSITVQNVATVLWALNAVPDARRLSEKTKFH